MTLQEINDKIREIDTQASERIGIIKTWQRRETEPLIQAAIELSPIKVGQVVKYWWSGTERIAKITSVEYRLGIYKYSGAWETKTGWGTERDLYLWRDYEIINENDI